MRVLAKFRGDTYHTTAARNGAVSRGEGRKRLEEVADAIPSRFSRTELMLLYVGKSGVWRILTFGVAPAGLCQFGDGAFRHDGTRFESFENHSIHSQMLPYGGTTTPDHNSRMI
jgi:hypothetical protein